MGLRGVIHLKVTRDQEQATCLRSMWILAKK
jgi:hypothetical protein